MMFKKKLVFSAVAAAIASGAMMSGTANATAISATTVGQLLLGDMYIARQGDYSSTRVKVINTDLTNAVKAKLVFRSKKHSDECRDLILYLSPGDVAYVDVRLGANGQPEIWSDDDSILASRKSDGSLTFASQISGGVAFPMVAPRTEPAADTCAQGHVEVVAAYAATGAIRVVDGGTVTVTQGMSKHSLARIFDSSKSFLNANNGDLVTNGTAAGSGNYTGRVRLKGDVEIQGAADRLRAPMVAVTAGTNAFQAVSTQVVTNPTFDTVLSSSTGGSETLVGAGFGDGVVQPTEMVADIEGALLSNTLFSAYEKGMTNFEVTFPTKYRHIRTGRYSGTGATYEAPFTTAGAAQYSVSLFDNQERSAPGQVTDLCVVSPCEVAVVTANTLPNEVNFEALSGSANWDPLEGWFRMSLTNVVGVDQYGTNWTAGLGFPVSGYAHYFKGGPAQSVLSVLGR